jgi:hypothetical protein
MATSCAATGVTPVLALVSTTMARAIRAFQAVARAGVTKSGRASAPAATATSPQRTRRRDQSVTARTRTAAALDGRMNRRLGKVADRARRRSSR